MAKFDKVPGPFNGEKIVFLTNGIGKTEYPPKNEVRSLLYTIKMNPKQIKDLNVRAKTIELLEENREKNSS